jgi:hypothetical protein
VAEDLEFEAAKGTESKSSSWWQTLPGVLTAIAGIITGIAGLVAALHQAGIFPIPEQSSESLVSTASSTSSSRVESQTSLTSSQTDVPPSLNPKSIALDDGMEVTLQIQAEGNVVYRVLSTQLEPRNAEELNLKLMIRCTNNGRYPLNFWSQSFRLLIDGVPRSPSNDLNLVVEPQSAQEGEILFIIPASAPTAQLQIGDPGRETALIPLDFSTARN